VPAPHPTFGRLQTLKEPVGRRKKTEKKTEEEEEGSKMKIVEQEINKGMLPFGGKDKRGQLKNRVLTDRQTD
jgi:hypothetical protein